MPEFVGYKKSTFDPEKYRQEADDNHGSELTTERIRRGIGLVASDYDADPANHWMTALKSSSLYIAPLDEAE